MRQITDHYVNGLNEALVITPNDPGAGGAPTVYTIEGFMNREPAERWPGGVRRPFVDITLRFQDRPIQSAEDFNGITGEALLAVLIDRMRGFQSGKFACRENAIALTKLEEAMMWLQKRTRDRIARGVEGNFER